MPDSKAWSEATLSCGFWQARASLRCNYAPARSWVLRYFPPFVNVGEAYASPEAAMIAAEFTDEQVPVAGGDGLQTAGYLGSAGWVYESNGIIRGFTERSGHFTRRAADVVLARALPGGDPYWTRHPARLIREELVHQCLGHWTGKLHGAVVAGVHGGILVIGPAGAGKTSLLCHALASGRYGLVANDRVLVRAIGDSVIRARGLPLAIRLTTDQLALAPDAWWNFGGNELYMERSTLRRVSRSGSDRVMKFEFTPDEVVRGFQSCLVAETRLVGVVVPRLFGASVAELHLEEITSRAVRTRLLQESTLTADAAFPSTVLGRRDPPPPLGLHRTLLAAVPWISVSGHFQDPQLIHALDRIIS